MAIKLTVSDYTEFEQIVWLKEVSPVLKVLGTVSVAEMGRVLYLAKANKQQFLLNENQQLVGKTCGHCSSFYTVDDFYSDKSQLYSKTTTCKYCRAKRDKQFKADNPKYFSTYWLNSREHLMEYRRKWYQKYPEKRSSYVRNSVLHRQIAMSNSLPEDKQYVAEINSDKQCVITGVSSRLSLDHVLPVTKGRWGNNRGNLMWLYESLNISKNNQNVFLWSESMEQERLDYLLPEGLQMTVAEFQDRIKQAITVKADEKGLTFEQYKQEYTEEYNRKQEEQ